MEKLIGQKLNWSSIAHLRERTILILRLLHLCRSVDLARMWRIRSNNAIAIRRKGQTRARFEALLRLPNQDISPLDLVSRYVSLTASQVPKGGPLFISLNPPYVKLTENSIARIIKKALEGIGMPLGAYGPHSTRGAGVKMYRKMGLSADIVCELGGWKNVEAFTKHYSRLNATISVGQVLSKKFVHKVPSCQSAEHVWSQSPGKEPDQGRSDLTCEAQRQDGPASPTQVSESNEEPPVRFRFATSANCRRQPSSKEHPRTKKPKLNK